MPGVLQYLTMPVPREDDTVQSFGDRWNKAFLAYWTRLTYIVNALSTTETLANRPPATGEGLDEMFFTANDTKQTFVRVSEVWENVGPRRGSATVTNPATTATVTLTVAEPDANYRLSFLPSWNAGAIWYTSKLAGSFIVNVQTSPSVSGTVDWTLTRD